MRVELAKCERTLYVAVKLLPTTSKIGSNSPGLHGECYLTSIRDPQYGHFQSNISNNFFAIQHHLHKDTLVTSSLCLIPQRSTIV